MDNQNEPIPIKRNRRGKIVHLDQKKKIIYLYIDLKKKEPDIKYLDLVDKLSEESGIGIGTVRKTLSEYKSSGTVSSPINKKRRLSIIEKVLKHVLLLRNYFQCAHFILMSSEKCKNTSSVIILKLFKIKFDSWMQR
ncbi:uncharacterized protein LOC112600797 [Melanaphis sacchari]|uniref:uncharacterized protein LOC112600797 n=1 Tax=Melanaphis sacchari TaxID=742174 RepID=UPI000DC13697|nr:uncharacterized protein LOC112600797 [Melanaphis sacchari]